MADWEDEDFDPDAGFAKASAGDKWEGEDEEENVKDDWAASDDDEEKKNGSSEQTSSEGGAFQVKKKKNTLEQALKKKAEKRKEKLEQKTQVTLTPEEEMEEKLRQQKLVEDADLELAKEAFGIGLEDGTSIDAMHPTTEEEFEEFGKLLKEKLAKLESSDYYQSLLEDVFQSCCVCLDSEQVKKLSSSLTAIANEKTKAQKALKGKKGKKKAALAGSGKSAKKDQFDDLAYGGDEFDDFM